MRAVVQRVRRGAVSVNQQIIGQIGKGYVILLGIGPDDDEVIAHALAHKIALLRVFEDHEGKMNLSILDVHGSALVISQFTLYADTRKGNRPSFVFAAPPDLAQRLVDRFVQFLEAEGVSTQTGEFGAHMLVEIENDGPVTIPFEMNPKS